MGVGGAGGRETPACVWLPWLLTVSSLQTSLGHQPGHWGSPSPMFWTFLESPVLSSPPGLLQPLLGSHRT